MDHVPVDFGKGKLGRRHPQRPCEGLDTFLRQCVVASLELFDLLRGKIELLRQIPLRQPRRLAKLPQRVADQLLEHFLVVLFVPNH